VAVKRARRCRRAATALAWPLGWLLGLTSPALAQSPPEARLPTTPPANLVPAVPPVTPASDQSWTAALVSAASNGVAPSGRVTFDLQLELLDRTGRYGRDPWDHAFPVLIPRDADGCAAHCHFDGAWLNTRLAGAPTPAGNHLTITRRPEEFVAAINDINTIFYENGYVDSGVRILPAAPGAQGSPRQVTVQLVIGILANCARKGDDPLSRLDRYALRRLGSGCGPHPRPFNAYALERDFRLLTADSAVDRVDIRLAPTSAPDGGGLAQLESSTAGNRRDFVVPKKALQLWAAVANDRAPSVGSVRSSIGAQWRSPLPYLSMRGEFGITGGVRDFSGDLFVDVSPSWRLSGSADHSDAAITEPVLRALDIRSKTTGFSGTLTFRALRCPLSPVFGTYPLANSSGGPTSGGIFTCPLPVRSASDMPRRWSPQRELSFGVTIADRTTDSSLLGVPFSFAPGAVDGHSNTLVTRFAADWLEAGRSGTHNELGWTVAARATVSQGLSGTISDVPGIPRPSPHFTSVNLQWNAAIQLPVASLVINVSGSAQWASGVLYTAERLPIGGATSVRGYELGTLLADRGGYASFNLNRDFSLSGGRRVQSTRDFDPGRFRLGAFLDAGLSRDLTVLNPHAEHIASTGAVAAWIPSRALRAELDWAHRFDTPPIPSSDALTRHGISFRVEFRPLELWGKR
jgi:hemolysin activation/secretion protein